MLNNLINAPYATTTIINNFYMPAPLNITEILNTELPPIDFVFRGLKAGTVGFLTSAGGVGKSMLAMQLAISLADITKQYNLYPFTNSKTKRGKVIYLSLEDPGDILAKRLKRILSYL
jgi:RecA-family ATPase